MKPSNEIIGFSEARERGYVIVGEDVYDVSRFAGKHRGGSQIAQLGGMDATLPLQAAHGVLAEPPRLPKGLRSGVIDVETLPAIDRDLRSLFASYVERGLFRYRTRWLVVDVARAVALFVVAWLFRSVPAVSFVLFTVAILNVMWWVHDVCHDSIFADRAKGKLWGEAASILFVGTPVLDYQQVVHRIHHGYTNVIGADQALDTGPVIWDDRMRERSSDWFVAVQAWAWFFLILPLTFPLFLTTALHARAKARDYKTIAFVVARWALVLAVFWNHWLLLFGPLLAAAYLLAFVSSLNHFHKPMSDKVVPSFAHSVTRVTQNLSHAGPIASWLTGGLNFHIEHHFFPTMPRHNYRVIAPEIRTFCARHGLEYSTCTFARAVANLWIALRRPTLVLAEAS